MRYFEKKISCLSNDDVSCTVRHSKHYRLKQLQKSAAGKSANRNKRKDLKLSPLNLKSVLQTSIKDNQGIDWGCNKQRAV